MARSLSDDVRLVIDTLGHVLRAHGGEELFDHVEKMRLSAKEARESGDPEASEAARRRLGEVARDLSPSMALEVARAFTAYFQLVNVAEDVHRTRTLRDREIERGPEAVAESLHAEIASLKERGATREDVLAALSDLRLGFVFTAHPTEARRRTTERLLADVRASLVKRDRRELTPSEQRGEERRIRAAIEALWEHAAERRARPEVLDEVKAGLWYLRQVLLDVQPRLMRRLRRAVEASYGDCDALELPVPICFGSWMGSDRDGNPYVTDAVTERTLELHRFIVLDRYTSDLGSLIDPLAAADHRLPDHARLDDALARAAAAVPELVLEAERRNPDEPMRRMLTFMLGRLERTRTYAPGAYPNADAFLGDLEVLRDTLVAARAVALPHDALLDLIQRVRCFGFHLAALDVREDSSVHREVVGELLGDPDYPSRPDAERRARLGALRLPERGAQVSAQARRLLDLLSTIVRLQGRFGPEAIGTYAISMAEHPADVLEILALARLHRVDATLDVVPLLETPDDLERAEPLLRSLFSDETYRAHLRDRGDIQELLLGYSDSMKQGGMLASRVGIADAQRAAARACDAHRIRLRVFHGRGGSVSRGGGPTYRAIGALPREAMSGQMKITEQGEMRAYNFANPDLAVRYLEQTVGAAIVARHEARTGGRAEGDGTELLVRLASASKNAYRELVDAPRLVPYFQQATPYSQIAKLNIASRPAKRRSGEPGLSDLRAIPWVFSWSQCRLVMTGWYGVGAALHAVEGEELPALYRRSPFLRDLLDNVEMALAKSDLPIARRYASLAEDDVSGLFDRFVEEHERTRREVLRVTGQAELLEDDPVLSRSIALRNPYVDPLSYLQITALERIRDDRSNEIERDAWERVARVAVQGIAAGLRHTG